MTRASRLLSLLGVVGWAGCAAFFGWDIHAPGILSRNFYQSVRPAKIRMGLYLPPHLIDSISKNRGGITADPQTYHVGEAFAPILMEAFQQGFEEFIFLETEPTPEILRQYAVPYVAVVDVQGFGNNVTLKGQAVSLAAETQLFDTQMNLIVKFKSEGSSDARKVFAKKGGPQVNLNSALENTASGIVQYLQDLLARSLKPA